MTPRQSKKSLELALLCIGILFLGYFLYGAYSLRTFKLKFSPATASEQAPIGQISRNLDELNKGIANGTVPWRKIDRSSVGFPEKEARLLILRSDVDFFSVKFGHHPFHIGELTQLTELPDFSADQGKAIQNLRKDCEIVNLETDSYILSCDAFSSLPLTEKNDLLKSFDRETEKFYNAGGRVILYVPPPISGKPPTSGTPNPNH